MLQYRNALQKADLKITNARLAILSYLSSANQPLDADSIYQHLQQEHDRVDKVTVYRVLDSFFQKGLITRLDFQEGKFRYEKNDREHHHLICEQCGRIEDMSDCKIEEFQQGIAEKKQFLIKRHSLEFYGICHLCQS